MTQKSNFYRQIWEGVTEAPKESPHLRITTDADGITLVELNNPPVNVMTIDFCDEFYDWMRWLGVDPNTKSVVLTSAIANHFCAGGDLSNVVNPTMDRFRVFWTTLQKLYILFNAYRKPIVTVATGTAPGMACVLALCSDYRIMVRGPQSPPAGTPTKARPFVIGLNEGAFGICLPGSYCDLYVNVVGLRQAEQMIPLGTMVTADEAVKIGLVDAAVDTKEAGIEAARAYMKGLSHIHSTAYARQRQILREKYLKDFFTPEGREEEVQFMFDSMTEPTAQAAIQAYVARLGKHGKEHKG